MAGTRQHKIADPIGPIASGISLREAARRSRKHFDYIRRLVDSGKLAGFRSGRRTYVMPADLDAAIRADTAVAPKVGKIRLRDYKINKLVRC